MRIQAAQCVQAQRQQSVSTWQLAAGGLQRKWQGIKQRTAWRFKTMKDRNTAIVFNPAAQKEKEILFKPRTNRYMDDPMACHNVLARASSDSLNGILSALSPQDSNQYCKTMTGFMLHSCPPAMRARILDVIAYKRLDDISIFNRAVIIRAIQRCLLSPLHREKAVLHSAACNILRSTKGKDLSLLKELVHSDEDQLPDEEAYLTSTNYSIPPSAEHMQQQDKDSDDHTSAPSSAGPSWVSDAPPSGDLSQLLFGNKNTTEMAQVMQHLAVEAIKVREEFPDLVKVVSDIDDTLYPGWMDRRYPLHVPYPGVTDLYARVSRGLMDDLKNERMPSSITFLTARPRGWLSVGRYLTVQHLRKLGIPNVTVLNGTVPGLVSNNKIAEVKLENFMRFAAVFPEFKFAFFGDSGQGDALLASRLLECCSSQVRGTFIHDINPLHDRTGDGQRKEVYASQGVHFFSTYIGAGIAAEQLGLISPQDLIAVAKAAEDELATVQFVGANPQTQRAERSCELEHDCARIPASM